MPTNTGQWFDGCDRDVVLLDDIEASFVSVVTLLTDYPSTNPYKYVQPYTRYPPYTNQGQYPGHAQRGAAAGAAAGTGAATPWAPAAAAGTQPPGSIFAAGAWWCLAPGGALHAVAGAPHAVAVPGAGGGAAPGTGAAGPGRRETRGDGLRSSPGTHAQDAALGTPPKGSAEQAPAENGASVGHTFSGQDRVSGTVVKIADPGGVGEWEQFSDPGTPPVCVPRCKTSVFVGGCREF